MTTHIRSIRKLFLYAGLERDEYEELLIGIREENQALLDMFSRIAAAAFLLLLIASMPSRGFAAANGTTYLFYGICMLAILLCSRFVLPERPELVMPLVCLFEIGLYAFGIHISTLHAEEPAVSAAAFLLLCPLLFYDRPIRQSALTATAVAALCGIAAIGKAPEVAEIDIWNATAFGAVAIVGTVFTMSAKVRVLARSRQIGRMDQTDLLTGAKTLNHYESRLQEYPEMCASNLACVYADVNGLRGTNGRDGRPAGDRVLRGVAEAMQRRFGQEHTYRVGGDEFVAFRVDGWPEILPAEIDQLRRELESAGCHVSFGSAVRRRAQGELDVRGLVDEAEANMLAAKRAPHGQPRRQAE